MWEESPRQEQQVKIPDVGIRMACLRNSKTSGTEVEWAKEKVRKGAIGEWTEDQIIYGLISHYKDFGLFLK